MMQRISFGSIAIAFLLLLAVADAWVADNWTLFPALLGPLARRGSIIPLFFTGVMLAGTVELLRIVQATGARPHRWIAVLFAAGLMLGPWLYAGFAPAGHLVSAEGLAVQVLLLAGAMLATALAQILRTDTTGAIRDVGATLLVTVYCGLLPSFLILLRCDTALPVPLGAWLVLVFLAVTKVSDIGAYFVGSTIGRHKLIPWVSPGKSVEGFVGGLCASAGLTVLVWHFSRILSSPPAVADLTNAQAAAIVLGDALSLFGTMTLLQAIVFGALMSGVGQLGDLLESVFKRSAGAKDSAKLIPQFGGVLDLVDSPVLAAPVAWFVLTYLWRLV
jgi:phosphatidate cytidylyltransferase